MHLPHVKDFLWVYLLYFIVFLSPCFSQSYNFKNYSAEDGLPFVQVYAIFQDSKGNLWTGGYGGMSRFDGKSFTNYAPKNGLADHNVTDIVEDTQGNIWIGTINGLSKFDGKSFSTFTKAHGLAGDHINSLACDKNGTVWIATDEGLSVYNGQSFTSLSVKNGLPSNNISLIYADKNGALWVNTDKGVSKIVFTNTSSQDRSFDNYSVSNGICDSLVTSMAEDDKGNLWLGTNSGLMKYDGVSFKIFTTMDGLLDNSIQSLVKDKHSNEIWVGTPKGLNKIFETRNEGYSVASFRVSDIQNGNNVAKLFLDKEENIWLGTSNGLYRFRDPAFTTFAEKEGLLNPFIFPVFRDHKKNLWVGTNGGEFYRFPASSLLLTPPAPFKKFTEKDGLIGTHIHAGIEDEEGFILMGTDKGLSVYNGIAFKNFNGKKDGLKSDSVTAILQDKKGRIWLGGKGGGTIFSNGKLKTFSIKANKQDFDVWFIFEDSKGNIWLGTYQGGLYRYDPSTDVGGEKKFEDIFSKLNLKSKTCLSIVEDKEGNMYLGSFEGVYVYHPGTGKTRLISEEDGLSSDLIYVMAFDSAYENLYIGTNQGINRLDAKEFNRSGKVLLKQYGTEDGLTSLETNSSGIWRDDDGTFWFGTVNGLIHFNPYLQHSNHTESQISIRKIRIFYSDTTLENNCTLSYNENNISFEYIGICLSDPGKVSYRYMLEGADKKWSPVTKETNARFTNLLPGKYTFKVISCNNEGMWNKQPAQFSFVILPPFWKTWWFRTALFLTLAVLIIVFLKLRAESIRKKEAERLGMEIQLANNELKALRSQMDPHFIFNSLSSIQSFIITKNEEQALRYLSKFAKLMRRMLSNSEKAAITIREEMEALNLYIELESLRWENKFEFSVEIDPNVNMDFLKIPAMLIQPFVENAIVHGVIPKENGKGKIEINISQNATHIICVVTDNGVGRKKSLEKRSRSNQPLHESMGMKITTERLELLNKTHRSNLSLAITDLEDESGEAQGTSVRIFIPINSA